MRMLPDDQLILALREMARVSAGVAMHCDRAEHADDTRSMDVVECGTRLRLLARWMAEAMEVDVIQMYVERLSDVEAERIPFGVDPSARRRREFRTWRDLQDVQAVHDRDYHPDVWGLSKYDQLRHYSFHLSKLTGHLAGLWGAEYADWMTFCRKRLPDILLFGIKLPTLANTPLPAEPVVSEKGPLSQSDLAQLSA